MVNEVIFPSLSMTEGSTVAKQEEWAIQCHRNHRLKRRNIDIEKAGFNGFFQNNFYICCFSN